MVLEEDLISQMVEIGGFLLPDCDKGYCFCPGVKRFVICVTRECCRVAVDDCPICGCTVENCRCSTT